MLHLNVGYHPTTTLATSTVWITCPNGDALEWDWQISEDAPAVRIPMIAPTTQPMPTGIAGHEHDPGGRRRRAS